MIKKKRRKKTQTGSKILRAKNLRKEGGAKEKVGRKKDDNRERERMEYPAPATWKSDK